MLYYSPFSGISEIVTFSNSLCSKLHYKKNVKVYGSNQIKMDRVLAELIGQNLNKKKTQTEAIDFVSYSMPT